MTVSHDLLPEFFLEGKLAHNCPVDSSLPPSPPKPLSPETSIYNISSVHLGAAFEFWPGDLDMQTCDCCFSIRFSLPLIFPLRLFQQSSQILLPPALLAFSFGIGEFGRGLLKGCLEDFLWTSRRLSPSLAPALH